MNVFLHYAIANVVNSLQTLEFESSQESRKRGGGSASGITGVAWDKLVGHVLILEAHIMDIWRMIDYKGTAKDIRFEEASKKFHKAITVKDPSVVEALEEATLFYHEILELLQRKGMLRFRPPRSLAGPREDT